ncbi:hypothetical protein [Fluviispira multicolorata]|uniref:TolB-like 6-blade propeller-like n=1 Tax=Fluviispira multicolorata TaxID=2654512 RepID=A0A833JEZ9_9BACT|nr:hypothetical protein [Fluviispira multicolorata]KAB8033471.1 hypothetical protein GCL57_01855 [Fluviispira multicolorata]
MKVRLIFFSLLGFISCVSQNQSEQQNLIDSEINHVYAKISKTGIITCFPEGTQTADHKVAHCEASAVVFYDDKLVLGNDKPLLPPLSPVFSIDYKSIWNPNHQKITYYTDYNFIQPQKFEDFTISLDEKYIFAVTAFDRTPIEKNDANGTLIYWSTKDFHNVKYVQIKKGEQASNNIRKKLAQALDNPEYFKIEGLAILPKNKLLFGVREQGHNYNNFKYTIKLISVSYSENKESLILNDDFKLIYNFENANQYIKEDVGLSSIEWDKFNNRLLLLTSFESKGGSIGAYLWTLNLEDLNLGRDPTLVYNNEIPLKFNNKSEGMTVVNKKELFIINDDDRYVKPTEINGKQYYKKANEAIFNIVEFN